ALPARPGRPSDAAALVVPPADEGGARWRAVRSVGVRVGQADTLARQAIEMWRLRVGHAVAADIAISQVIHDDEHDVRLATRLLRAPAGDLGRLSAHRDRQCGDDEEGKSHGRTPCGSGRARGQPASTKSCASSRVRRVAETSLHPVVFCPAHNGEKSLLPRLSAVARSGAIADAARGKAGATALTGPNSLMMRFMTARAGRPVNRLVSAVTRARSLFRAVRCTSVVVASGHNR